MTAPQIGSEETFKRPRRIAWQFTLRSLLLLVLCACFFFGGWTANDWWRRSQLSDQLQGPVRVEYLDSPGIYVIRGQKSDVNKVQELIKETGENGANGDDTSDEPP